MLVANNPPAVIIIARHGARLDAADDQWIASSTTPYDTPLSYGGWTQTRALGARIASLLHARDVAISEDDGRHRRHSAATTELSSLPSPQPPNFRKHKVVIHSSPFLRCIQSSIAISAGMGHYHGNLARVGVVSVDDSKLAEVGKSPRLFGNPARSQTLDSKVFEERLSKASAILDRPFPRTREDLLPEFKKPTLRVDAFLGEWLSPDYYEFITAPPESKMMVAGAKAELLKQADTIRGAKIIEHDGSVKVFPSADSTTASSKSNRDRGVSFSLEELARNLPSHAPKVRSMDRGRGQETEEQETQEPERPTRNTGYIPPTPTYALLPKAPIPTGYVAHARDQCTDIDFSWDSMREPQLWGDGGQYGEEWSSMHRRFRSGFGNMVQWYKTHDPDFDPQQSKENEEDKKVPEDATETVLVIVTHGAGCNALIGALTNQPVLMDVGMGSLTMAVRKPHSATSPNMERSRSSSNLAGYGRRRASSVDMGLHQEYDMKMIASSEHLRAGADPLTIPQLAGGAVSMPAIPESNPTSGSSTPRERAGSFNSKNSALGSMRRTSVKAKSSRAYSPSPVLTSATSSGLWGGSGSTLDNAEAFSLSPTPDLSPTREDIISFNSNGTASRRQDTVGSESAISITGESTPPTKTGGQVPLPTHRQGLWGSGSGQNVGRRGSNRR